MTRGYVCITKGKEIKKVAYLSSDAYLSYYGVQILGAIMQGTLDGWMDKQINDNHACYGDSEPDPNFSLNWIMKTKENKDWEHFDFSEYGYWYNEVKEELWVYNYGELICKVTAEEREKYFYYFQNCHAIQSFLYYDADKMDYNYKKPLKTIIANASLEELKQLVKDSEKPRPELTNNHCCARGHSVDYPKYIKRFSVSDNYHTTAEFICAKEYGGKWEVLVQLPYCRAILRDGFGTETAAVKYIRSLIKKNTAGIIRFMEISLYISSVSKETREEVENLLNYVNAEWEREPWFTANGNFTLEKIKRNYTMF